MNPKINTQSTHSTNYISPLSTLIENNSSLEFFSDHINHHNSNLESCIEVVSDGERVYYKYAPIFSALEKALCYGNTIYLDNLLSSREVNIFAYQTAEYENGDYYQSTIFNVIRDYKNEATDSECVDLDAIDNADMSLKLINHYLRQRSVKFSEFSAYMNNAVLNFEKIFQSQDVILFHSQPSTQELFIKICEYFGCEFFNGISLVNALQFLNKHKSLVFADDLDIVFFARIIQDNSRLFSRPQLMIEFYPLESIQKYCLEHDPISPFSIFLERKDHFSSYLPKRDITVDKNYSYLLNIRDFLSF